MIIPTSTEWPASTGPREGSGAEAWHEYHLRPQGAPEFGELGAQASQLPPLEDSDVQAMKQWQKALAALRRTLGRPA